MIRVLRITMIVIMAALAASIVLVSYIWFEVNVPRIERVSLHSDKIGTREIRIVQVTDVHGKKMEGGLFEKIEEFKPEAIVLTGDLVDKSTLDIGGVIEDAGHMTAIAPVFFVTGNHDIANPHFKDLLHGLSGRGVRILRNDHEIVGDQSFALVGVDFGADDVLKASNGVDTGLYTVLIAHTPSVAFTIGPEARIDLLLAGHTHGGQVRLPFISILPDIGVDERLIKGIAVLENGLTVYTDSGYGTSVIPVRFMDRSQISFIKISGE